MSAETAIYTALKGLVSNRVYPDVAPSGSALPRIVYQQVGGQSVQFMDGTLPNKENGRFQVACWGTTRVAVVNLAKQVETAICAVPELQATPLGARVSEYEDDTQLYSARQDFSCWPVR